MRDYEGKDDRVKKKDSGLSSKFKRKKWNDSKKECSVIRSSVWRT